MTMISGYDNWKLGFPDQQEQLQPYETAVSRARGIFAWQDFCLKENQNEVQAWAWETCKRGPFITPIQKLVFFWILFLAFIRGQEKPIQRAALDSAIYADADYLDACSEVEQTWRDRFVEYSLIAVQQPNYEILLYPLSNTEQFQ